MIPDLVIHRGFLRTPFLPLIFLTVAGCDMSFIPADAIMHPTPENLPPQGGPLIRADTVLSGSRSEARALEWTRMRHALLDATTEVAIGSESVPGPELFGVIADVTRDGDGNVYVLDRSVSEVRVFDASGNHVTTFGGEGQGPDEFLSVESMVVLSDGRVVIGDHSGPAKVFAPSTSGYELVGPLLRERPGTALHVDAMCSAEDRMFIHSRNLVDPNGDSLVIHEVSADSGRVLGSLAEAYRSEFARDRTMRSLGTVACADEPVSIVYGNYYFPIVKSYLPDGTHRWTALIEEYAQSPVYQNNPSEPTVAPRMGPSEYISSVQAMPSGFVVLQTALYEYVGEGEDWEDWEWQVVRRRTYLLDGATGEGGLVSDSLPAISWTGDSTFVAEWSFPYPRIEVRLMSPSNLLRP